MKRILILTLLVMAVACNEKDDLPGQGAGNPLSECVLPAVVQAGEDLLVQWNGFGDAPSVSLVSEDGDVFEMEVSVVTGSGIVFSVPYALEPGQYDVMSGDAKLGTVEITAPDMPVTGLKVPSGAGQGEEVTVEGLGFEEGCAAVLVDSEGKEHILEVVLTYSGISLMIPEDIDEGDYDIFLIQGGLRWQLSSSFSVYEDLVVKTLSRIDYYTPYTGSVMMKTSWSIMREAPVTLTVSEYVIDGDEEYLQCYDEYQSGPDGYFSLVHDGFDSSNDMGVSYVRNAEGTVTQADVLIYGHDEVTPFVWTYDPDGFLTDISSPKRSFRSFTYEAGNLVKFRNTGFEYSGPQLVNHPAACDVIWGYMAVMEKSDPFVYIPYFMGWYAKSSSRLPSKMLSPSPTGTGTDTYELSYEFDSDGYVIRMSWGSDYVEYHYSA